MTNKGKLIILSGLPASGKDSLMNKILENRPDVKKIVTYTDRPIRVGEVHKFDYHFVTTNKFKQLILKDFFLEYVKTGSFFKGTSKKSFSSILKGENIIWRIDISRAVSLDKTLYEKLGNEKAYEILSRTTRILVEAGSSKEALNRFKSRNPSSSVTEFHSRYESEIKFIEKHHTKFSHILKNKNGEFDKTLHELNKII